MFCFALSRRLSRVFLRALTVSLSSSRVFRLSCSSVRVVSSLLLTSESAPRSLRPSVLIRWRSSASVSRLVIAGSRLLVDGVGLLAWGQLPSRRSTRDIGREVSQERYGLGVLCPGSGQDTWAPLALLVS